MPSDITKTYSDKELIQKISENSETAFKSLFTQYYGPLVKFSFYRIRNLEASKDLVQEVFTNLWISRKRLNPERSIKAYLYRSVVNQIINLKKHSSAQNISFDESISSKENSNMSNLENQIDIFSGIDKLPDKLKNVFLLSRSEGFKYSEIAEICGISVKAVEKRMSKTFKILRKFLTR